MGTLTTKLKLFKPATTDVVDVVADLNNNYDIVDSAVGDKICTSSTRPSGGSLYAGLAIYETDTHQAMVWDGAAWKRKSTVPNTIVIQDANLYGSPVGPISTVETIVASTTSNLITGEYYTIEFDLVVSQSTLADRFILAIREDNVGGTARVTIVAPACPVASSGFGARIMCDYMAAATAAKTFVATLVRVSGSGSITMQSGSYNRVLHTQQAS
jgi:hypothetical protein